MDGRVSRKQMSLALDRPATAATRILWICRCVCVCVCGMGLCLRFSIHCNNYLLSFVTRPLHPSPTTSGHAGKTKNKNKNKNTARVHGRRRAGAAGRRQGCGGHLRRPVCRAGTGGVEGGHLSRDGGLLLPDSGTLLYTAVLLHSSAPLPCVHTCMACMWLPWVREERGGAGKGLRCCCPRLSRFFAYGDTFITNTVTAVTVEWQYYAVIFGHSKSTDYTW